ncbi:protein SUPPRESSOR OF FRI 4-like [Pyrus ussuriensis x Pyrus communis]|uniref:Protein SUPPRESSOR OF FRI 4-like n=1 Tax=Pyrus ussuriensis x Pyrus communis TaxID=2448454 RepID=A0A5N5FM86_9ROSA|nr:protein SUPPRESSOR OF FRI 4-like [Pyrus ussuriensis x Pyrus communis]
MYKFSAPRFFGLSLTYIKDENDDDRHKAESELSTAGGMAIHVDWRRGWGWVIEEERFGGGYDGGVEGTGMNLID